MRRFARRGMVSPKQPEPWLRGTMAEVPAVARAVIHALELAREDLHAWCDTLSDEEMNARPARIAPVAFHIRHMARSTDRLLTYAEGQTLTPDQLATMKAELEPGARRQVLFAELDAAFDAHVRRILALGSRNLEDSRTVGKKNLPATLGGLLVHVADHVQRHAGQAITTSKIVAGERMRSATGDEKASAAAFRHQP
jgi:uncharacterized damage-inducible protein DinB